MEPLERRQHAANLQQDFAADDDAAAVGDDEPLVRSYLEHFFVDADDYKAYAPYINDQYLKQVFAETKIVNGLGDAEKWYSMLPPGDVSAAQGADRHRLRLHEQDRTGRRRSGRRSICT